MSYLQVDSLVKRYGPICAINQLSLQVERGELFALVGPDGAGKTSLIRSICRLIDIDSGSISVDGQPIGQQFDRLKAKLGYMPQIFSLYPDLSVEENLIFFAGIFGVTGAAYRTRRDRLYEFSQLGPFARRRAGALSGGMKQKLALSCALMHDPELLILDEPTTGVDPLSRRQFWEILASLKASGSTILVCTPYMDEAERADRVGFLFGGTLMAVGTVNQLTASTRGTIYALHRQLSSAHLSLINNSQQPLQARRFGPDTHVQLAESAQLVDHTDLLTAAGISLAELVPAEATLEDRFIQLIEEAN